VVFIPLYLRIKDQLRTDILEARRTVPGGRLPTERELAARYQVSRPTVSKALSLLAAEGFLTRAQGRGSFRAAETPPPLIEGPSRRIGYVAPISGNALVQRAFRGIDRVAHRRERLVLMGSAGFSVERERQSVCELIASGVQGLIIYPVPRTPEQAAADYLRQELPVPLVLIDTCTPDQGHVQVVFDNHRAARCLVARLHARGHRRIALLTYASEALHEPLAARKRGYLDGLRDHGLPVDAALIRAYDSADPEALPRIVHHLVEQEVSAVLAPEDTAAVELIEHLLATGVQVPDRITVVGFDNREVGRRYQPAFTTTNPDFERMGELACELLLEQIDSGQRPARTHVLEVPILVRRSVHQRVPGANDLARLAWA